MPKPSTPRFAPGVIEHIPVPTPRSERIALTLILFVLLMTAGACLAALLGYIELQGIWA